MRSLVIVTGSAQGIGAQIAEQLAVDARYVAVLDRSESKGKAVADGIVAAGHVAKFFPFDLADLETHETTLSAVEDWGGEITCLVNNAGVQVAERIDMLNATPDSFDRVLDANLRGTFFFTQSVAKRFSLQSATAERSIVVISSSNAELASIERAEYCLSKSALSMLVKLFAIRLAALGVGVFEIRPGIIRTPMTAAVAEKYTRLIDAGLVPMRRWGQPSDVAHVVSNLAAGHMGYATGSVINVDGALAVPHL